MQHWVYFGITWEDKKEKINLYWGCLSNYAEYNSFFEQEFTKDLKNTKFDYSLISLGILERKDKAEYKLKRDKCLNMKKRILYHGSQIDPISSILTEEFKYTRKAFYGMGIYFSDMLDYVSFYSGGTDYYTRRALFGKILPVQSTFSCVAAEVFYTHFSFCLGIEKDVYSTL